MDWVIDIGSAFDERAGNGGPSGLGREFVYRLTQADGLG